MVDHGCPSEVQAPHKSESHGQQPYAIQTIFDVNFTSRPTSLAEHFTYRKTRRQPHTNKANVCRSIPTTKRDPSVPERSRRTRTRLSISKESATYVISVRANPSAWIVFIVEPASWKIVWHLRRRATTSNTEICSPALCSQWSCTTTFFVCVVCVGRGIVPIPSADTLCAPRS